jgi:hypothetical protein
LYYEGKKDGASIRSRKTPVLIASAPAIVDGGIVTIGSADWYRYTRNRRTQYTRDNFRGAKPAGAVRDLLCREFKNSLALVLSKDHPDHVMHRKLARQAIRALENVDLGKRSAGANQSILVPTFLAARLKTPLRLRIGPELEEWTIHCASTGRWRLPGDVAETGDAATQARGKAKLLENGNIFFKNDEFEDEYVASNASVVFERRIDTVFGETNVAAPVVPLIPQGKEVTVKEGEPLFGPIPRKEWTIKEFRALPEDVRLTCFYLAAISAGRIIDNLHYLDTSMTLGGSTPVADLGSVPTFQTVSNSSRGLDYKGAGVSVSMMSFIRHHMDLHRQIRKEQRERTNAKPQAKESGGILKKLKEEAPKVMQAHA